MSWISTVVIAFFLSTIWLTCAILARSSDALFLPQAFRYLLGALVLGVVPLVTMRRPPGITPRLLHASLTVGGLCYFIAPVFTFYALRVVPSGMAATIYMSMPLWYLAVAFRGQDATAADFALAGIGLVAFAAGILPQSYVRGPAHLPLLCLAVGMLAFMVGGWVSRRLFWLHSALDLGFWSMLLAGVAHVLMGIICGEHHLARSWDRSYWGYLIYLGVFVTGVAAYLGRVRRTLKEAIAQTLVAPAIAFALAFLLWRETPLNPFTAVGFLLVLVPVGRNLLVTPLGRWMALTLYNEKRQGDRLVCQIDAEIGNVKSRIVDIGLDGVGFRSESEFRPEDLVPLRFPIGRDGGHVSIEGRIVHLAATGSKDYPFAGGMEFIKISIEHKQSLVEFLARLARAEER